MTHHDAQSLGFSDRPLGTMAVRVEPANTPSEGILDEAVLKCGDLSVHVSEVHEQGEGWFIGTVCGFTPRHSSHAEIALGDQLSFRSTHVFTFTGFDDVPPAQTRQPRVEPMLSKDALTGIDPITRREPERPSADKNLPLVAAAILVCGIAVGYVIGRSSAPTIASDHYGFRPGLKLDYELGGQRR